MQGLTESILKHLSTATSFARGWEYYEDGMIADLVRDGDCYHAKVLGSMRYLVEIENIGGDWVFDCDCPYDYGGICKHCVAVGLAIIHQTYTEIPSTETITVEELIQASTPAQQQSFLKLLLAKNPDICRQFSAFIAPVAHSEIASEVSTGIDIEAIRQQVYNIFSNMDFTDLDYDSYEYGYSSGSHFHYHDDAEYDIAKAMIKAVFDKYQKMIQQQFQAGKLVEGISLLCGVYEGYRPVEEPAEDEYCLMEDYAHELANSFDKMIQEIADSLKTMVFSPEMVIRAIEVLFQRVALNRTRGRQENVHYSIKPFEKLFFIWLTDKISSQQVEKLLHQHKMYDIDTAYIWLTVKDNLNDDHGWLSIAEEHFRYEPDIAKMLLSKYDQLQEPENFLRIARESFAKWPARFDTYLLQKISQDTDPVLYKDVLSYHTFHSRDIKQFRLLRPLLNDAEFAGFLQKTSTANLLFFVKILWFEERFEDILQVVKNNPGSYDFNQLIQPVLNVFPDDCYRIITEKVTEKLAVERGRPLYKQIVLWLTELKKIEKYRKDTAAFIAKIYNWEPRLPALRDEMKKADIMP